jgi:hypothetical protein
MAKTRSGKSLQDLQKATTRELTPSGDIVTAVCVDTSEGPIEVTGSLSVSPGATSTTITNLAIGTAATEVSHALVSGVKTVIFRARGNSDLQFAFTATESGTKFMTVKRRNSIEISGIMLTGATLYIQSNTAPETVEILELS